MRIILLVKRDPFIASDRPFSRSIVKKRAVVYEYNDVVCSIVGF